MAKQLEQALREAHDAYTQAYGQVHKTPDGMFCWIGRLDRAYTILADAKDDPQTRVKLENLEMLVKNAIALADGKYNSYHLMAVAMGKSPKEPQIDCGCQCCTREETFRLVAAIDKCAVIEGKPGGLLTEEADKFQADADKLGIAVEWQHFDLKTYAWAEGRGA